MLLHLVFGDGPADALADVLLAAVPFCRFRRRFERSLCSPQQIFALTRPLSRQQGVAADHESLSGVKFFARDLGHVALVEKGGLQRAVGDQSTDPGRAQGADPIEPRRLDVFADTSSMPRSPTRTTHLKRRRNLPICAATVDGSAVLPLKASIATGHPARSHSTRSAALLSCRPGNNRGGPADSIGCSSMPRSCRRVPMLPP